VQKDLHAGNIFVFLAKDKMVPTKEPIWSFKVGDFGISRLEDEIRFFGTVLAQWMLPPEYLCPHDFGFVDRRVDIYHVGLLLLRILSGAELQFTADEIVAGRPREMAESLNSKYGPVIARALRRHVEQRTPTPLQMWRELCAVGQYL
jgi:serine/threonine-protein kinase